MTLPKGERALPAIKSSLCGKRNGNRESPEILHQQEAKISWSERKPKPYTEKRALHPRKPTPLAFEVFSRESGWERKEEREKERAEEV